MENSEKLNEKGIKAVENHDYDLAVECFEKAAELGNIDAMNRLGVRYSNGQGVFQDYKKAVYWFEKAAQAGHDKAIVNLAKCYNFGDGVECNKNKAREWLIRSASQGYLDAQELLIEEFNCSPEVWKNNSVLQVSDSNNDVVLNGLKRALSQKDFEKLKMIEDSEVVINSLLKFSNSVTFSNCNITIEVNEKSVVEVGKCDLTFEDCEITVRGSMIMPTIVNRGGSILFDSCSFAQEYSGSEMRPVFISSYAVSKKVELINCEISGFKGNFISSKGTSVYADHTEVKDLVGSFVILQNERGYELPTLMLRNSNFLNCKNTYVSNPRYSFIESENGLIEVDHAGSALIDGCSFVKCYTACIHFLSGDYRASASITNCKFDDCTPLNDESGAILKEKNCISESGYKFLLKDCTFNKVYGVYINAAMVKKEIVGCKFIDCKKDSLGEGFLSILVDVDEPIIMIKDCLFRKCINEDRYKPDSSGIVYLGSPMVEKCNKETVLIENLEFEDCEAAKELRGVEKQDGFWGGTVKLFRYI